MRLIPVYQLILTFVVLSLFTSGALLTIDQVQNPDSTNQNTETTTISSTDDFQETTTDDTNIQYGEDVENDRIAEVLDEGITGGPNISYPFNNLAVLMLIYAIFLSLVGFGFQKYFNRPALQRMINTALELSGYESRLGHMGRSLSVDNTFILEISSKKPEFIMYLPETSQDPRIYGFRSGSQISVSCRFSQVQLTLQSIKSYLS